MLSSLVLLAGVQGELEGGDEVEDTGGQQHLPGQLAARVRDTRGLASSVLLAGLRVIDVLGPGSGVEVVQLESGHLSGGRVALLLPLGWLAGAKVLPG